VVVQPEPVSVGRLAIAGTGYADKKQKNLIE